MNATPPTSSSAGTPDSGNRRPARGLRALRRSTALLVVLLTLLGGLLVLTRTPLTKAIVLNAVESATGTHASAGSAVVRTDGSVEVLGLELRTPGVAGEAGVVFRADRASIRMGWGALLGGRAVIRSVELDRPVIRVSQSVATGAWSVTPLLADPDPDSDPGSEPGPDSEAGGSSGSPDPGRGSRFGEVPELIVRSGVIELGEHDLEGYRVAQRWGWGGGLVPDGDGAVLRLDEYAPGVGSRVVLLDDADRPTDTMVELSGGVSAGAAWLRLGAIDFEQWPSESLPGPARELFNDIAPQGRLSGASLHLSDTGEVRASVVLDGVGVTLPFDNRGNFATEGPLVRMHDTRGEMRIENGQLVGAIEGSLSGLPYQVTIESAGLSTAAPFTVEFLTESFRLGSDQDLMLFLPEDATYPLELFGNPTGLVDARVVIARNEPGGRVGLRGGLTFRDAVAAYEKFPYRFEQMEGAISFTRERMDFHRMAGRAPNGATIEVHGFIGPYDDDAVADIRVECRGIPIDDELRAAMDDDGRRMLEVLFNRNGYERLLESGLVARPGDAGESGVPEFAMGGTANVSVRVTRVPGPPGQRWTTTIDAVIPSAGMVPEHFTYPIIAEDVGLSVTDSMARLEGGRYRGLGGGRALVDADVGMDNEGDTPIRVNVRSVGFPVDDLLVFALPDPENAEESIRRVVSRMNVTGVVDATADVLRRDSGRLGYDVEVALNGVTAAPGSGDSAAEGSGSGVGNRPALELRDVTGTAYLTESFMVFDARAEAGPVERPTRLRTRSLIDLVPAEADDGAMRGAMPGAASAGSNPYQIEASAVGFDMSLPIEALVGVFSTTAASAIVDLRERHAPAGRFAAGVEIRGSSGSTPDTRVRLSDVERIEFDAWGGRVAASDLVGEIAVQFGTEPSITLDARRADAWFDDDPVGELSVIGRIGIGESGRLGTPGSEIVASVDAFRFESDAARSIVRDRVGGELGAFILESDVHGVASVGLRADWVEPSADDAPKLRLTTLIEPREVRMTRPAGEVQFSDVSGTVRVTPAGSGQISSLRARVVDDLGGRGWDLAVDGRWEIGDNGSLNAPLQINLDGPGLGRPVRALLPTAVDDVLSELSAEVDTELLVNGLEVHATRPEADAPVRVRVGGEVSFRGASLTAGTAMDAIDGRMILAADLTPDDRSFRFEGDLRRMGIFGASLTDGRFEVTSGGFGGATGEGPRDVVVRGFSADLHGGRVAGSGIVRQGDDDRRSYEFRFSGSGVRFDTLLADLRDENASPEPAAPGESGVQPDAQAGALLEGSVLLEGVVGDASTRIGRGVIQAGGGPLIDLPLILPLVEVSNLQVPTGQSLGVARSEFYITGDHLTFDALSVFSNSVELFGYGTMTIPDLALDLRFHSRAVRRVPLLSQIVEGLRDELVSTTVTGTLRSPDVNLQQLRGTRQVLGALFGRRQSEAERRLDEIERRAREIRLRTDTQRQRGRGLSGEQSWAAEPE